jgi:DNA excision repair protein ERCC-2
MREGQREFYLDALDAAENGKVLLANAPTGIGKTAAVLSAALESALPNGRKVLFLTNRSSHHPVAVEEIKKMNEMRGNGIALAKGGGSRILLVDKIAKERMCLYRLRDPHESGSLRCEMSRSFCKYSRPNGGVVLDVLEAGLAASGTNSFCATKSACPHFAALAAMEGADVIIADYRYLFDEGVRKVFFQTSGFSLANCDVIIDEAHNLPDAVREINSPVIDQDSCLLAAQGLSLARKLAKKRGDLALAESFSAPHAYLRGTLSSLVEEAGLYGKEDEEFMELGGAAVAIFRKAHYQGSMLAVSGQIPHDAPDIASELVRAANFVRECFTKGGPGGDFSADEVKKMEELARFLATAEIVAGGGKPAGLFARNLGENKFIIKAFLFDPSEISREIFAGMHSAVLMSGTLVGKKALVGLLGIDSARVLRPEEAAYKSAFSPKRNPIAICTAASSRMRERAEGGSTGMMARIISEAARGCLPHSAAVFYPSYDYMATVSEKLELPEFLHESEIRRSTGKAGERKARLERGVGGAPVLFHAVIGGSYSEGVDFKNNPFKLIIVAGFAHPKSGGPHSAYETYLGWKFKSTATAGLYASIYPAIIRSVQALGRGIRSETDWCYGLFIDDRFETYRELLPAGIRERAKQMPPSAIGKDVRDFMEKAGNAQ